VLENVRKSGHKFRSLNRVQPIQRDFSHNPHLRCCFCLVSKMRTVANEHSNRLPAPRRTARCEARIRIFDESVSSTLVSGRERRPLSSQLQQEFLAEHFARYAPTTQVSGKKSQSVWHKHCIHW